MSDNILAHHLLKNANLKQSKEQLIKATISNLHYNLIKEQLKKYSVTCHLPVPIPSHYQWKHEKKINLNVIQIQTLKNSSTNSRNYTKTITSLYLLMPKKKQPTNLMHIRDSLKAKTHLILKAI